MKHLNFSFQLAESGATEMVKFHCFYDIGNYGYLAKGRYIKIIILNGFVS